MPNIKASVLSVKKDQKRRARNIAAKTGVKKATRKVLDAIKAGNADEVKTLFVEAQKAIDRAAREACASAKTKNNAARKKSRLAKKINAMQA